MTNPKFYKVFWRDHASSDRWHSLKEVIEFAKSSHEALCESNGYLIHQTDNYLVLAASHTGDLRDREWGDIMVIYKNLIVRKVLIEFEEKRKRRK